MTLLEYLAIALISVLGLYIAARVISAAIFKSKQDFDRRNANGTQQNRP